MRFLSNPAIIKSMGTMITTDWVREKDGVSVVVQAKASELLALQGFLIDALNEVHFRQCGLSSDGTRSLRFFIKEVHFSKLKMPAGIMMKQSDSNMAAVVHQIILQAESMLQLS
jgi:hypothetical protein